MVQELQLKDIKEYKTQAEQYIFQIILELEKKTNLNVEDIEFYLNDDETEVEGINIKLVIN